MVHIGTESAMKIRRVMAITFKASDDYVEYYVMNIFTGEKIHRYNWKEFPTIEEIWWQAEKLAGDEGRPIMGDK